MDGLTKSFGSNEVLRGVNLELHAGRVTALLGANGAGKSTVIKILSGVHPDYGGTITIDGAAVVINSPATSRRYGIEPVHQRINEGTIPGLSVAENLLFEQIVNNEIPPFKSLRSLLPMAREVAAVLDLGWSDTVLRKDVNELLIADQQLLLLARALVRKPRLLILDEPTSALSDAESARLFDVIDQLRKSGVAILFVTHRLREIDLIADDLLVLRDGEIRGHYDNPFDWPNALHDMLGHTEAENENKSAEKRGCYEVLKLFGVKLLNRAPTIDVEFRAGEVAGVFGLLGAGKSELARGIFGAESFRSGTMTLKDEPFTPRSPSKAISRGVFMVPEDRAEGTIIGDWSVARTVTLPFLNAVSYLGTVSPKHEATVGRSLIEDYGVVAESADDSLASLSGGNQQKVAVGRWLKEQPLVMLLDEPFQGVDIGARRDLIQRVREVAGNGSAVILLTSDLEEIMQAVDRVLVLVDGRIQHDAYLSETSREKILESLAAAN